MKVIHCILGKSNPNRMNGVNKVVNNLASVQVALGKDVEVWGITKDPDGEVADLPYSIRLFQALENKMKIDPVLVSAIKEMDPKNTVFHIHGTFIFEFVHVSKVLRKCKIPYVITSHGTFNVRALNKGKWRKKVFFQLFDKKMVKGAKAMHFIGQSEYDALDRLVKGVRKELIPNGQNFDDFKYTPKNVKEGDELVFGFCGRMKRNVKGLDILIYAFSKYLAKSDIPTKLWIIGDGDDIDEVKYLATDAFDVQENIKFWGSKFGEEKCNIIANMDVFFHTSRYEGLPGAVLEACGLQVPCIVSKETNMAEYIETADAGIALEQNNSETVAKAMLEMAERWKYGSIKQNKENAEKMVKERFDWKVIAEQLQAVYES